MSLAAAHVHAWLGGRHVLRWVSVDVRPGSVLALVGPNGAGKSTLLRILSGELVPREGSANLDMRPLASWRPLDLARRRAVLPQRPTLDATFTVREVVRLGRHPHRTRNDVDAAAVRRALAQVGLLDRADDLWTRLSGGEQQRVGLARALAQLDGDEPGARYLLLDEPTSALDLAWQHRTLTLARSVADRGDAVLIVLHDLQLAASFADRVALLVRGELAGVGAPIDVLHPAAIARAWGVEATWIDTPERGPVPIVTGAAALATH